MDSTRQFAVRMQPRTARLLSLFAALAIGLGHGLELAVPDIPRTSGQLLAVLRLAGLGGAILLFLSVWGQQAMAKDAMIDERQQRERDRAFAAAHRWMVAAAILAFFYTDLSRKLGLPLPADSGAAADLINVYVLFSLALPGVVLAWRTPADLDDDA